MLRIKCTNPQDGNILEYLEFQSTVLAEMVFYGFTHDREHMDAGNWDLEVQDSDKQWILVNWHYPVRG